MPVDRIVVPRAEVLIDLGAVGHNVALLAERAASSGAKTMAVVKADGYGHGAVSVARTALRSGASCLGVASIDEALALRAAGISAPVLAWLHTRAERFESAVATDIDVSVSSQWELAQVAEAGLATGKVARVHLKVDTGLSRNGCTPDEWPPLVAAAAAAEEQGAVRVIAVWSHLACADEPAHPSVDLQAARFDDAYQVALEAGLRPLRHLANSAALLVRPDLHFDIVRAGIAMYGLNPVPWHGAIELRPAMTFRSSVALVKRVEAGEAVSYGHTWTTPRRTTLALVPVGYADGVPRVLSGRMQVWLAGARRPMVGRVCMDQIVVDCGDDPVAEGEEVLLFGPGDRGEPTAQEWADVANTIHYEIVTGMYRSRVRRTVRSGETVATSEGASW